MSNEVAQPVVGRVLKIEKHPNANKLFTALVAIDAQRQIQVIFGMMAAVNEGDLVPVAVAPITLPTGLEIERKEIRGVLTEGMLCLNSEMVAGGEKILTKFPEGTAIGSPAKI